MPFKGLFCNFLSWCLTFLRSRTLVFPSGILCNPHNRVLLCASLFVVNIIRFSIGLIRGQSLNRILIRSLAIDEENTPVVLLAENESKAAPELAGIDWAAKNIEDKWEQPVVRRLHLNPSDLKDEDLVMPIMYAMGVELQGDHDLDMALCQFDISPYHRNPEQFPMSRDLVGAFCSKNRLKHKLASVHAVDERAGKQLQPTGFIFHESRVGSTLVANMLASVPTNLVYSEPSVPAHVIHLCKNAGCSEETTVRLLRMAILAMGRSHHHDHFFIKFSSSTVVDMDLILKAFPETPWAYIYRDPVEIIVSNFQRGRGGPCIRAKKNAPKAVQDILETDRRGASRVSDEEYCAAHLTMLCQAALEQMELPGSKGHAVAYETLVEDVLRVLVPGHFGVSMNSEETARMTAQSELYSKARTGETVFQGDTEQKQERATQAMQVAAEKYLKEPTERLRLASTLGRSQLEIDATLRAQEARVYERTGSRFFQLPHCPDEPESPPGVPIMDILGNWNMDDTAIPPRHYNTLCRFDYQTEYDKALRYRDAEMPFVVYNIPEFDETVEKWNSEGYLAEALEGGEYTTQVSKDNHFMYYRLSKSLKPAGYIPPTRTERWSYDHWLHEARKSKNLSTDSEHYYFRVSDRDSPIVRQDLTIFTSRESTLFMKEPEMSRGIHCRFGMRSVIAEAHFDASRNMVGLVSGTRRWILAHPRECKHAYLLPTGHPSARHTEVDWSAPDLQKYPDFVNLVANEVLLTPGEVLNVPAWWIHTIENLDINIQCNSRSGDSTVGLKDLKRCGFFSHDK